jgi:hypothetical protein
MNKPVFYHHSFGYGSYILHQKSIDTCHTNTQFSSDTFFLVNMDYLQSMTYRVLGAKTDKEAF